MRRVGTAAAAASGALVVAAAAVLVPAVAGGHGHHDLAGHAAGGQRAGSPHAVQVADSAAESKTETSCAKSLRPSGASGAAVKRIKKRGKLIAGVDQNSYHWGYLNPNDPSHQLTGFDIDIVRAIAKDILGDPNDVIYRTIPTSERISALQDHKVDVVVRTMTITCQRAKQVAFSAPYFMAGQQVLAPVHSPITGYDRSLSHQRVCTARGSTGELVLNDKKHGARSLGAHEVLVPNQLDCLVKLQLDQVDAVITDNALGAGQAAQDPTVHLVGDKPFTTEPYGVAVNKHDDDLVRRVNKVLQQYTSGGSHSAWRQSYDKWLADVLPSDNPKPPQPVYRD